MRICGEKIYLSPWNEQCVCHDGFQLFNTRHRKNSQWTSQNKVKLNALLCVPVSTALGDLASRRFISLGWRGGTGSPEGQEFPVRGTEARAVERTQGSLGICLKSSPECQSACAYRETIKTKNKMAPMIGGILFGIPVWMDYFLFPPVRVPICWLTLFKKLVGKDENRSTIPAVFLTEF